MNLDIIKQWVGGLRDPKYKQIKGQLCDGHGGFCALGVLMNVMGYEPERHEHDGLTVYYTLDDMCALLSAQAAEALGIKEDQMSVTIYGKSVTWYNDEENYSFATIANLIEKEYLI